MAKKRIELTLISLLLLISICFFLDQPLIIFMEFIKNPVMDKIMLWFSNEITVFTVLIIISALFMYQERKTNYIGVLLVSFFASAFISQLLKILIMRPRPLGMQYLELGYADSFNVNIPDYSFPSLHATSSFSVLPVLDKEFKKLQYFWIFFSVMIAISRIYLKQHYLSDVVTGAILGYYIGVYVLQIEKKHGIAKKFLQKI